MEPILSLFSLNPAPLLPASLPGWLGWFVFLGLLVWLLWSWRFYQSAWDRRSWAIFIALGFLTVFTSLLVGIRFPAGAALPQPAIPQEQGPTLMFLSALPWLLAGGMLGPLGAAILGLLAGSLRFLWDAHSIFAPLEYALLGVLFSVAVRQRYRTWIFRLLREPLAALLALAILYIPLYVIDSFLAVSGALTGYYSDLNALVVSSLDYALTSLPYPALAMAGELLIAGLFAQVLAMAFPDAWGRRLPLQPSPGERSLEARFLFGAGTLVTFLLVALLLGDWLVAGTAAREMLRTRMKGTAEMASESVPFFLETGQNLAAQFSTDPRLVTTGGDELSSALGQQIRSVPYFDQLIVLDRDKNVLGSYPPGSPAETKLFPEESAGTLLAFSGVLSQTYSIPPAGQGQTARISFLTTLIDPATRQPQRLLIARTNLGTNPFTRPLIDSLKSMSEPELAGQGILLDEHDRILFHPNNTFIMNTYTGRKSPAADFFDDTAPNGTRDLVYYQPVTGNSWTVVLTVPAQQAQEVALTIAAPLSALILLLGLFALVSLRFGLKVVTTSLQNLTNEAMRIAQGQLDHALHIEGVDEVGQLRRSFEQMRASLQLRLEELNRLLLVSQGVASSLELQDAVQPVMEAVLATGAAAVRLVMPPLDQADEQGGPGIYALGPSKDLYAYLDDDIIQLAQQQGSLVLSSVARGRGLSIGPAEVGRQRLAAILDSTPDPVLVTDQNNRMLLSNPAAWQVLGAAVGKGEGQPIERVIDQKPLLEVLQTPSADKLSAEVVMPNGQVYLATASSVLVDGRLVGRVCILRDVTHFKELDTMKTEFVNTVSHDLRSPLTLMRGYATMFEMVGQLNEQQKGYAQKMIVGVDNMTRLVNNLLDLGRIDVGVGLQLETVPLLDIIERVTGLLQLQASEKEIKLGLDLPRNTSPLIQADQALLQQAVYNLVENAIKYTPRGGQVDIALKLQGESILLAVHDTGIGVAPADQARLFEKFYRGTQREAREQKGSGLGLAIVKSIAEKHGGKVWLESQLGKGSTFFLQVPLRQPK